MNDNVKVVRTSCRMCHGVCQVLVHVQGDRVLKVTDDPDSPTSKGYICPKGKASVELLYHPDRLKYPMRRAGKKGENKWERITWNEAVREISSKLQGDMQYYKYKSKGFPPRAVSLRFTAESWRRWELSRCRSSGRSRTGQTPISRIP